MKVEIYSDIVCPWCYIGERRFARALSGFAGGGEVQVVFRPYQLDPEAPDSAVPLKEYLEARYGPRSSAMLAQASEAAAAEGITIDWESALSANTLAAHRLLYLAESEYGAGVQRALAEKLFELHFTRGGDVSDYATLVEVCESAGLDPDRVRTYLDSAGGMREVAAELMVARQLGIQAVPTFVIEGGFAVQGAQPVSWFLRVLEEVDARAR